MFIQRYSRKPFNFVYEIEFLHHEFISPTKGIGSFRCSDADK